MTAHPIDICQRFVIELEGNPELTREDLNLRSQAMMWVLDRCEELSAVIAALRNADATLEYSTDLGERLKASNEKARIYAIIDKSMQAEANV